ncbi:MAG: alpha/beta hydrolase [Anaerolineae bacterium]|nr:alpha/beta hydrolase [Thermoflexales bacterium]MDW8407243.1 alpha/beta hydrolase [Anaerolineae bacterium]
MGWFKKLVAALAGSALLIGAGFVGWAQLNRYSALDEAATLVTPERYSSQGWLVFDPPSASEVGLIFYPGGLVDPAAYAPAAQDLAKRGIKTIIVPMPLDLAVLAPNRAADVVAAYPEVKTWVVGGHSLGGAMAALYLATHANTDERLRGLVLWGSRVPDRVDLSKLPIEAVSIYGTRDGIAPPNLTDAERLKGLPVDARLIVIEGGNHSGFGSYGFQNGDLPATVSPSVQRRAVVEATADFVLRVAAQRGSERVANQP